MKNLILLTIAIILVSCNDDDSQTQYCGVTNPAEDLDWLRIIIEERKQYTDSIEVYRMEMPDFGEKGFLYRYAAEGLPLPPQEYYYTCNGTYICSSLGGIAGTDCNKVNGRIVLGELVYKGYE